MSNIESNIVYAIIGILVWDFIKFIYRQLRNTQDQKAWSKERDKALDTLSEFQFNAHYYLPSVGNRDNKPLCNALDSLAGQGFIITNNSGDLVGKVAKANMNSNEVANAKRATFKVVE